MCCRQRVDDTLLNLEGSDLCSNTPVSHDAVKTLNGTLTKTSDAASFALAEEKKLMGSSSVTCKRHKDCHS